MKRPSFQFYPGDWLNDAALRACSVGARGLWIDMLCLMHQGSEYGYLKVNHNPILPANLARMLGATIADVEGWIAELESFGVFSRDVDGCIMSRRMINDEKVRQSRAAGGALGGNPALKVAAKVKGKVNLPPNLEPTPSSSSSPSTSSSLRSENKPSRALKSSAYSEEFESAWLAYPSRPGSSKADAFKAWSARLAEGVGPEVMIEAVKRYAAYCTAMRTEPQYIKQPATFFGPGGHIHSDWSAPRAPAARPSVHSGFEHVDYRAGINDDGSFE